MTTQPSKGLKSFPLPHHKDQLDLEYWSQNIGGDRATAGKWWVGAEGFMSHAFAKPYLKACLEMWWKAKKNPVNYGAMWDLMADEKAVAQVFGEALIYMISNSTEGRKRNNVAASIGRRAEFVLWLNHPEWKGSQHLKGLRLANGRNLSMSLIKKRLIHKGFGKAAAYQPLLKKEQVGLGTLAIEIAARVTGLMRFDVEPQGHGRQALVVRMTDQYWEFMKNWKRNLMLFRPSFMPMVYPPVAWTGLSEGGYLSLATTCSTVPDEKWAGQMRDSHPCVLGSHNWQQSVAFNIDYDQCDLIRSVWDRGHGVGSLPPRDPMEKPSDDAYRQKAKALGEQQATAYWNHYWKWKADQRKNGQRTQTVHNFVATDKLKPWEKLWFTGKKDHRGRFYPYGSAINYQGNDHTQSQLTFNRAAPIAGNEKHLIWAIGEAWGVDPDWEKRYEFFGVYEERLVTCGQRELDCIGWWERAKKPWRLVSLCRELARFKEDYQYRTKLPFRLDQTCSAYGHAACLIGDAALADLTNITGEDYRDLYSELMETAITELGRMFMELDLTNEAGEKKRKIIEWWMIHKPDRKLIKQCCMPIVYGRSYNTMLEIIQLHCREKLGNFLTEDGIRIIDLAGVLAKAIDNAAKLWLPGINDLHAWLRKCAKVCLTEKGMAPWWKTPNGMTVCSYGRESTQHDVYLELSGRRLRVSMGIDDGEISSKKTFTRICADYIHSQDAAFLERFVWHWAKTYKYPLYTVHDCVAVNIDKVDLLNNELRDQFCRFYSEDHLMVMRDNIMERTGKRLPVPPARNTLKRSHVGENRFLFS